MTTAPRTDNREKMVYIGTVQKFKIFGLGLGAAYELFLKLDNREKLVDIGTGQKFKIFGSRSWLLTSRI